jgi:hypothetical protein
LRGSTVAPANDRRQKQTAEFITGRRKTDGRKNAASLEASTPVSDESRQADARPAPEDLSDSAPLRSPQPTARQLGAQRSSEERFQDVKLSEEALPRENVSDRAVMPKARQAAEAGIKTAARLPESILPESILPVALPLALPRPTLPRRRRLSLAADDLPRPSRASLKWPVEESYEYAAPTLWESPEPAEESWPELLQSLSDEFYEEQVAAAFRRQERLERLDREQRGVLWSA